MARMGLGLKAGQAPAGVYGIVAQGGSPGATPKTRYLDHGGGRIAFDLAGAGPLVICVPSMGDLRAEYRFLIPQLVAAGYTVATMDLRGQGESSVGWQDYSAAAVGADMLALARDLDRGPAILAGDSMAGAAAVWAAAEAPAAVAGLVLIDPVMRDASSDLGVLNRALYSALFADLWGPFVWQRFYGTLYPGQKPAGFGAYVAALGANLRQPGRMDALRRMILTPKGVASRLSQVTVSALIVMGTRDPDFKDPAAEARWLGEKLHAQVRLIEGAGHYPHAEQPAATGAAILAFLQTIAAKEPYGQ
jgi:pimeloyl-ACP methyl ester carboxylesterase